MIKFKDVAHLYLGVECKVNNSDLVWYMTAVQSNIHLVILRNTHDSRQGQFFNVSDFKPLLRPLSDMEHDEVDEVWRLLGWANSDWHNDIKYGFIMEQLNNSDENDGYVGNASWGSLIKIIPYLLSRGFDLFGLIESGEAIDKTKHK